MDAKAMERAGAQTGVPAFSVCFVSVRDPSDKEVLYGANRTHRSAGVGGPDPAGARGFFNGLVVNGIVGVILLFLTNLVLADDIPINLITILICAIGGVVGYLVILVLHVLGIAFTVAA